MAKTEVLGIQYDEDSLSAEEQEKLEHFAEYLGELLDEKIKEMGLCICDTGYGEVLTKFTEEEWKSMPVAVPIGNGYYRKEER